MTTQGVPALLPRPVALERETAYRLVASVSLMLAGVIHLVVVPEHLGESLLIGMFFIALGLAQIGFAVALRWALVVPVLVLAAVAHLGVIALYVTTRAVDLPFLPVHEGSGHAVQHLPVAGGVGNGTPIFPNSHIEPVGSLDLLCLVAELVVVAMIVGLLSGRSRRFVTNLMLCLGASALLLRGVGLLL